MAPERSSLASLIACGSLSCAAVGQIIHEPSYTLFGASWGDQFGKAMAAAGDVNNDGTPDFIVGAAGGTSSGVHRGSATVYSGVDGAVLHVFVGDAIGDGFGTDVDGGGDVNNDGHDDLIVGSVKTDGVWIGYARVFSGADGSVLFTKRDGTPNDKYGEAVAIVGDVNADGHDDFAVGAWADSSLVRDNGSVRVYSGASGVILYHFRGERDDWLGYDISRVGDVNGDGRDDVLAGGPGHVNEWYSQEGAAWLYSGANGGVVHEFDSVYGGSLNGSSVGGAGDVDDDGVPDVIIGAPHPGAGRATVYSGADGTEIHSFVGDDPGEAFGRRVDGAGDVNGDGHADLIVGADWDDDLGDDNAFNNGYARVFSGSDGAVLYTFYGDDGGDRAGWSVCGPGDLNGDGFADFIVGAFGDDDYGSECGSARVFLSGFSPCNAADLVEPWGLLDLTDIVAFINGFVGGDPIADLDDNGVFDIADIDLFVQDFTAGCPEM